MRVATTLPLAFVLASLAAGCGSPAPEAPPRSGGAGLAVEALDAPAGAGSSWPRLSVDGDRLVLTWVERSERGTAVRFAERRRGGWSDAATVAESASVLGNWADVPVVAPWGATGLAAAWTETVPGGEEATGVRLSVTSDAGAHWTDPAAPHADTSPTEHGFASIVAWPGGGLGAVWLDGRQMTGGHGGQGGGDMSLRAARLPVGAPAGADTLLDARTCECCPTAAVRAGEAVVVAYRDRGPDETRDVAIVRQVDGRWTDPRPVHADGWIVAGCPVNGPALDARGERVVVAWFTAARDEPAVQVAFSDDAGASWSEPVRVDMGAPLGRVTVAWPREDEAVVGWLEADGDEASFLVLPVHRDGTTGAPLEVARMPAGRASGGPRLARAGDEVLAAWTATEGDTPRVRIARLVSR